jgi:hypothetical protein
MIGTLRRSHFRWSNLENELGRACGTDRRNTDWGMVGIAEGKIKFERVLKRV